MRRWISLSATLLICGFILSFCPPALQAEDLSTKQTVAPVYLNAGDDIIGHWAEVPMRKWASLGWFLGDGAGTYRPNDTITCAEFITLINKMKQITDADYDRLADYRHLAAEWYYPEIAKALTAGYLLDSDSLIDTLHEPILRQEAFVLLARAERVDLNLSDPMVLNHVNDGLLIEPWAEPYVSALLSVGLIAGDGENLYPLYRITRAETITLLDRIHAGGRTFAYSGTFGPVVGNLDVDDIVISAPDVTLRNVSVKNDLRVAASVYEGSLQLRNIRVFGAVVLDGGGDTISLINCDLQDIEVNQPSAMLLFDFPSSYRSLTITGEDVNVTIGGSVVMQELTLSGSSTLFLDGGVQIERLTLLAPSEVAGAGDPALIYVDAQDVKFDRLPKNLQRAPGAQVTIAQETFDWRAFFGIEDDEEPPVNRYDPPRTIPVRRVALTKSTESLRIGESLLLVKTIYPSDATEKRVVWQSDNEQVATVTQGGRVVGVAPGRAVITVTTHDGQFYATCAIAVS